jgi:hypothetical protein
MPAPCQVPSLCRAAQDRASATSPNLNEPGSTNLKSRFESVDSNMLRRTLPHFATPLLAFVSLSCSEASEGAPDTMSNAACSAEAESIRSAVFAASCDGAGCHGSRSPAAGLDLMSRPLNELVGTSSALCSGWSIVVPGSPEKSFLYHKLTASTPACGERMPLAGHVSDADAKCVADWITGMASGGGCETCGGPECVALAADAQHCGSCENACPEGVACENGQCVCAGGGLACRGSCVDAQSDPANCGGCGKACSPGASCAGGVCACPDSLDACGASCADLQSDPLHCGGCERACGSEQVCLRGACADGCGSLEQCGSSCVDTQSSVLNCGGCGAACAPGLACESGECVCQGGGELCGSQCVDTSNDAENCGACGQACGAGEACSAGACRCAASSSVSFKADVAPILDGACTSAGCHTGVRPKEGLGLDASDAYAELVNVATAQCGGKRKLVVPGSPSTSYLMHKLLNIDVCTGSQMPKAGQSLPQTDLDAISGWICAGAPNN